MTLAEAKRICDERRDAAEAKARQCERRADLSTDPIDRQYWTLAARIYRSCAKR